MQGATSDQLGQQDLFLSGKFTTEARWHQVETSRDFAKHARGWQRGRCSS